MKTETVKEESIENMVSILEEDPELDPWEAMPSIHREFVLKKLDEYRIRIEKLENAK